MFETGRSPAASRLKLNRAGIAGSVEGSSGTGIMNDSLVDMIKHVLLAQLRKKVPSKT